jgi:hypothetical protein
MMFANAIALNEFQIGLFEKMIPNIDEATLFQPALGHGHSPVWILGHLAVTGDMGRMLFGKRPANIPWMRSFGPGSQDPVAPDPSLNKDALCQAIRSAYGEFRQLASQADPEAMAKPTTFELFQGTPIQTLEHVVAHLLTSHFGFHLAQLSSCRRAAGHAALF